MVLGRDVRLEPGPARAVGVGHEVPADQGAHLGPVGAHAVDDVGARRDHGAEPLLAEPDRLGVLAPLPGELQLCSDADEKLAGGEGLDDVVVGAGADPLDAGLLTRAGGEEHDRQRSRALVGAQRAKEPEAVQDGHHHVAQDQVRELPADRLQRLGAVRDHRDLREWAQQSLEVAPHVGVVVGDEDLGGGRLVVRVRVQLHSERCLLHRLGRAPSEPAGGLLDERHGSGRGGRGRSRRSDPLGREVTRSLPDAHREAGAPAGLALDRRGAAVKLGELSHQGEPDARALEGPAPRALDPVEALEEVREGLRVDPRSGVPHHQPQRLGVVLDVDADPALEGELEGVGDQVEHDLLPHLPVDVDRLGRGRAIERQLEVRAVHDRLERAGDLGGERSDVDRLVRCLDPSRLDAAEVQQRVDELQQPRPVSLHRELALALPARQRVGPVREAVIHVAEHEGQRRAELVAHVAEEDGLGLVQLGQRLGATALLLVRARVGDRGGELRRHEIQEVAVAAI